MRVNLSAYMPSGGWRRGSSAKRAGEGSVGCNQSDMKQYLQFEGINTTQLTSACRVQCAAVGKGGFKAESRGVVFLAWMLRLSVIPAGKQTNKDEVLQTAALLDPPMTAWCHAPWQAPPVIDSHTKNTLTPIQTHWQTRNPSLICGHECACHFD